MQKALSPVVFIFAILTGVLPGATDAQTRTLCARDTVKLRAGKVKLAQNLVIVTGSCPKGFSAIMDGDSLIDPDSPEEDSKPDIYGDASSGDLTIDSDFTLLDPNRQYRDITISAGATLTVPSGTMMRCTGSFENRGMIKVVTYARGATRQQISGGELLTQSAHPGLSKAAAGDGEYGPAGQDLLGGDSEQSNLSVAEARNLLRPGPAGGGGGGASTANYSPNSGDGGGTFTVLCHDLILNAATGVIDASGRDAVVYTGSGGGAGGIVILASPTEINNQGVLRANGGNGGFSTMTGGGSGGPGGGGGGGIVHLISNSIFRGIIQVTGGAAGALDGLLTRSFLSGGGEGGSLGGHGGAGGLMQANGSALAGEAGGEGIVIETPANPATLF